MAWGDHARTDYAADKAARTGRGDYLTELDTIVLKRPFNISAFTEASQSAASWADAADVSVRVPDYATAGWFLHGRVWVKVAAGSGGQVRLRNVTDGNNGTAQTGISATSYTRSDDLSVQVDSGEHTLVNILVQIQGDGSNLMYAINTIGQYTYNFFYWSST